MEPAGITPRRRACQFFVIALLVYAAMTYGGIRSPDSEVTFRTAEALATHGTFAVPGYLEAWKGFGMSYGTDGRLYSIFGVVQPVAAAPLVKLGLLMNKTRWYEQASAWVPMSHYYDDGFQVFAGRVPPGKLEGHAVRAAACVLNLLAGALCAAVFYLLARAIGACDAGACFAAGAWAFGSLLLPYTGTFLSEPLATFFVLASLLLLVRNAEGAHAAAWRSGIAGLSLGLASDTHITAILYAPFFCLYAAMPAMSVQGVSKRSALIHMAAFGAGLGILLLILGAYNAARFGSVFETGRTANPGGMVYATYVAPWRGLYGLLLSSGKGLLLYCPAVLLGLVAWRSFHRRHAFLSYMILSATLLRLVFIASRSDWHGGFCVGPRYLVMLVPLLLLPFAEWASDCAREEKRDRLVALAAAVLACVAQQLYFALGEIFSFYRAINSWGAHHGVDVFKDDALYLDWTYSPLPSLLGGLRGPLVLQHAPMGNYALWGCLVAVAACGITLVYRRIARPERA